MTIQHHTIIKKKKKVILTARSEKSISVIETIPAPPNEVRWLHSQDVAKTVDFACAVHPS